METTLCFLTKLFREVIESCFPTLCQEDLSNIVEVTPATKNAFGHYQCNSAMRLAKREKKAPQQIAKQLIESISSHTQASCFEKIEIAGAGFINITLSSLYLEERIKRLFCDPHLGTETMEKKRVVVDFSAPNVAKQLHVGHLRSTIIGDALARVFEWLGADVLRLNHIGDWGTAFGMLIHYLQVNQKEVGEGDKEATLAELEAWYKEAKRQFDADPEFKQASKKAVVRLQQKEPQAYQLWEKICAISRRGYDEIYRLLDVKLVERGESFYNPLLAQVIEECEQKQLLSLLEGAKCLYLEGFVNREGNRLPLIVQKSDGGYNYSTTDLAAMYHRSQYEKAERIIIVTDSGQTLHFQMIRKAAEKLGYLNAKTTRFDHVPFGLVLRKDGKKFQTREGETEKLIDLLNGAIEKAKKGLEERHPDWSSAKIEQHAITLGIGAVKYADLSNHRMSNYAFDEQKMLCFEGNTAPFILYAYVRTQSVKRKAKKSTEEIASFLDGVTLDDPSELELALHINRFGEVMAFVLQELLVHRLTEYLYKLANLFHSFFETCRIVDDEREQPRLVLCEMTGRALKRGLALLGVNTLEQM